jgi:hypothetical protein
MANRSDFFNAKLPRSLKRMLTMAEANGWVANSHERGSIKRSFIAAHANHVSHKLKRQNTETRDTSDAE